MIGEERRATRRRRAQRQTLVPERPDRRTEDRSEVREAVKRFLLIGLATLLFVSIPVALWILFHAERHALDNARTSTQRLADFAVGPLVTDELFAGDAEAIEGIDRRLDAWLNRGPVLRIKVWDENGRIVYSDVDQLIGEQFALPGWANELLDGGEGQATIEPQEDIENEFEENAGELVEVYVLSTAATGEPLIFEAYYDDDDVRAEQSAVLWETLPAVLVALVVLQIAQLVPAVALAKRIQHHEETRRTLMQRSIEASDLERRRIARDLHDEVIQDLAGLSYAMEAEQMRATPEQRPLFTQAHSILQDNVRTLRAMTRELYPTNLEQLGLPAALNRLADPLREAGIQVTVSGTDVGTLPRDTSAMFYRVAREALVNILKHARADTVELTLDSDDENTVLVIRDDGRGFDLEAGPPDGHLGLQLMKDTIKDAGGSLEVVSRPGQGTVIEARMATPERAT
ncbi:sensor histidine kinase [Herbiconiux sp. SYSU D00978]|uniref:sensor histidine kinase n=1 Tax=Herbiconiux sp. SYSU D00978 TaxID=2812562 RepID=UPI001A97B833|nr:sensor histidine kinase [Herbiconiux sp. SYSU D00978]